ncbi:hypothetical protein CYY_004159 [Polysphondylium violaceum]|uniref:G-protein coupled receptors family 2 profile 2 domain-containing protein n=1 Tax=Polysphondylium violaceum TaxID=133409 RepID=A0A8J4PXA6_9MYCE|nr:hypothetical protein CYY_004159 [Polysphondylium violaceum]
MSSIAFIPGPDETINRIMVTVSSSLSLVGCLFIICCYLFYKELKEFQFKLIFILTINDLIISLIFLISTHLVHDQSNAYDLLPFLCSIPDSLLHYFYITSFFWNSCIANTLLQVIKYNNDKVDGYYKMYHLISWGLPSFIMAGLFLLRYFKHSDCSSRSSVYPHLLFFIPLLASWIFNIVVCFLLTKSFKEEENRLLSSSFPIPTLFNSSINNNILNNSINSSSNSNFIINNTYSNNGGHNNNCNSSSNNSNINNSISNVFNQDSVNYSLSESFSGRGKTPKIIWTSIYFLMAFGFCWVFTLISVVLKYFDTESKYILMLSYLFTPMQGFMNALIYGVNDRLRKKLKESTKRFYQNIKTQSKWYSYGNSKGSRANNEEHHPLYTYEQDDIDDADIQHYHHHPSHEYIYFRNSANYNNVLNNNNNNSSSNSNH